MVLTRGASVAVKAAVALLCALGLVAMHQLPAGAAPEHRAMAADAHAAVAHSDVAALPMAGHPCAHDGVQASAADDCADHDACQALVPQQRTVTAPPEVAGYAAVPASEHVGLVWRLRPSDQGGDPPDLHVLSVSRT